MSPETIIRSAYDAVRRRDMDALLRIFSPTCEFIDVTQSGVMQGHEQFTEYMHATWAAFPDFHPERASLICEGEFVAAELVLSGTHQGDFLGVRPSGATVRWPAAAFYTTDPAAAQIIREVYYYDAATLRGTLERSSA